MAHRLAARQVHPCHRLTRFGDMRIVIAGGHGQIARHFSRLVTETGHEPVGIVRNPDHVPDLEDDGAEAVVLDLEDTDVDEVTEVVRGADAVVFAAGGGPDGNAARKETVDKGAAIMLADAAEAAGVRRYVMVSAMGTDRADPDSDEVFQVYLRAKKAADDDLRSRDLDWTVVRPGRLTTTYRPGRCRSARSSGARSPAATWRTCSPRCSRPTTRSARRSTCSTARRRWPRPSRRSDAPAPVSRRRR